MSKPFNRYQTWLNIEAHFAAPDYYRLLGIERWVDDIQTIARAADRRLAEIRKIQPGDHATEWATLLDEIRVAKDCLTDPQRREKYDKNLPSATRSVRASALPSHDDHNGEILDSLPPVDEPAEPPSLSDLFPPGISPVSTSLPETHTPLVPWRGEQPATDPSAISSADIPDNQTQSTPPVAQAIPVARVVPKEDVQVFQSVASIPRSVISEHLKKRRSFSNILATVLCVMAVSCGVVGVLHLDRQHNFMSTYDSIEPVQVEATVNPSGSAAARDTESTSSARQMTEPSVVRTKPRVSTPIGQTPLPPPTQRDTSGETNKTHRLLHQALERISAALADRNIEEAQQQLTLAHTLVHTPEEMTRCERFSQLVQCVSQFWEAVHDSIRGLQGELHVKDEVVVYVIDSGTDWILVRHAGQSKRYELSDMPSGLVLAIANRWLKPDATSTKILHGAFYLAEGQDPLSEARELWQQAGQDDPTFADMLKLLDDPLFSGPE